MTTRPATGPPRIATSADTCWAESGAVRDRAASSDPATMLVLIESSTESWEACGGARVRASCHGLSRCRDWRVQGPAVRGRPPEQTAADAGLPARGRLGPGGPVLGTLLIDPLADDAKCFRAVEREGVHQIGNGAVHVAAAAGAKPFEKGLIAVWPGPLGPHRPLVNPGRGRLA